MAGTAFYHCWQGIKRRCNNPKEFGYKWYGGRGITYPIEWNNFKSFYDDMFTGYFNGATIERINVNKGYSKENCKWATRSEQSRNRRSNIYIEYKGRTMILKDWAKELGINYQTLRNRIVMYKIPVDKAFVNGVNYAGKFNNKRNS